MNTDKSIEQEAEEFALQYVHTEETWTEKKALLFQKLTSAYIRGRKEGIERERELGERVKELENFVRTIRTGELETIRNEAKQLLKP